MSRRNDLGALQDMRDHAREAVEMFNAANTAAIELPHLISQLTTILDE